MLLAVRNPRPRQRPSPARLKLGIVSALLAAAMTITACGDDSANEPAVGGRGFNAADVQFATDMIPHHAQALSMVDMTAGKDINPAVAALAEKIRMAQTPEIERMAGWLHKWGKPIPRTGRDHSGHGAPPMDMPGMASMEDMAALEQADGHEFEQMFLTMMIDHHRGAIQMAKTELAQGENLAAKRLAQDIIEDQRQEIRRMEKLLRS